MKIKVKLYTILEKYAKGKVLKNSTIILHKYTTLQGLSHFLNIPDNNSEFELIWGDFFKLDISEASVVTLFLSQEANDKLKKKFEEELRPDARIVSFHWIFNGWCQ